MDYSVERISNLDLDVITTRIRQTVIILDENIDTFDLRDGLADGKYHTTLDHQGISTTGVYIVDNEGNNIALIIGQETVAGNFSDIRIAEDPTEEEVDELINLEDIETGTDHESY